MPVTPGTLYLAHFAGPAGAVALLSIRENGDAASLIAGADSTGRMTREEIVAVNPFLKDYTAADLRLWADWKMRNVLAGGKARGTQTFRAPHRDRNGGLLPLS